MMIYIDTGGHGGRLVHQENASVHVWDRGFNYGDGLFETMLAHNGQVPLLDWHLERLTDSARALGIAWERLDLRAGVAAAARSAGAGEHAIRLTLSRGLADRRGYEPDAHTPPTLVVMSSAYRRPESPFSLHTASLRVNPDSPLARHKTLSALEKVLARAEAARAGASDALMLNLHGRVAEGAATNLFIRRGSRWLTPALSEGCLAGIMRRRVIGLTQAEETQLAPEDLLECDGVYLTSALLGCVPVRSLDGIDLPRCTAPSFAVDLFRAP